MSKKCKAYSASKLGLEAPDTRKAFYAGWDAAIEAALTPGEPVAFPEGYEIHELPADYTGPVWIEGQVRSLYARTAPQPAKQPLTDDEISDLWLASISGPLTATKFARAIERAHGIGGQE
jgi:hypothetical protein